MNQIWIDTLNQQLTSALGKAKSAALIEKYKNAFPTSYTEECSPQMAIKDISQIEKLSIDYPIDIDFYMGDDQSLHLRVFQYNAAIPLSDILPMLENLDLRTFNESPYKITLPDTAVWISDFTVSYARGNHIDTDKIKDIFQESFINTRLVLSENDGFNKLVLAAQLSSRDISIFRAYAKYLRQTTFIFTQPYIEQALVNNAEIAKDLISLFKAKFDPSLKSRNEIEKIEANILQALESVTSLDEDRILRTLLELFKATLRTNFFQTHANGKSKEYLSFKLQSQNVPFLPLPLPLYEIFVYSPRFEGVHLRGAKVARGGIRWSDRREDFRTEVLGLMKAQKVKNAVIVPSGAKGGFVLKTLTQFSTREQIQKEVVECYKSFIRGLLDLTDNLQGNKIIKPEKVICYDDNDTYLVVAADKGTATFSDIANSISKEYGFWLGDAFASGGSVGYDHKKMGITARGAWESVKRHFHELDLNIETTDFTVVGIGDMSGDVFGNGMLYTPHIKLIAAFDHRDIFLDPDPNPTLSFNERQRLFNLPTSSWQDYDAKLISAGGGIFKRSSKSITLSPEMKKVLGVEESTFAPNDLIRVILKAPVDLIFNGGIGTYVKASTETHADVGDKTNEYCRINGDELRCRVVGEGGNLGFTQLGRVEYALQGGLINTDFIDNSAGVDCSDHEVNIKILLNQEVAKGKITESQRNDILASMTQEVADLVLHDNFSQALVMSIASFFAPSLIGIQTSYIKDLELSGELNRTVEFLPDEKHLIERKTAGLGLTRPELAVLLAYTKIHIKSEILNSDIPDHPFLSKLLDTAFPPSLQKSFQAAMEKHSLRREIIATQLSNQVVNETGITFVYNLQIETGATVAEILRAYIVASRSFETPQLLKLIESFGFKLPLTTQYEFLGYVRRLTFLATRWFLRHIQLTDDNMPDIITHYGKSIKMLETLIPNLMSGTTKAYLETLKETFTHAGLTEESARRIGAARAMYSSLNVIEIATKYKFDLEKTANLYFRAGERFNLLWFRDRIASDSREGYWDTLARLTLRDELDVLQKLLTVVIMKHSKNESDPTKAIDLWIKHHHRPIDRWENILTMLHSSTSIDYVMFFIALRELSDLLETKKNPA
ncbi:MAG: NAD-glutamate dehydrogenase [Gammaproteobacteria bacterium]|nr:NAD-glutamate dehydrogenase [Gammaproteobacteria bacterium]